jgi:hypothetical protein
MMFKIILVCLVLLFLVICIKQRSKLIELFQCKNGLLEKEKIAVFQGHNMSEKPIKYNDDYVKQKLPYVDGKNGSSLFMFSQNVCSPNCCPSPYSCDSGCLCMTGDQQYFLQSRGGNANFPRPKIDGKK